MLQLQTGTYPTLERQLISDLLSEKQKDPMAPLLVVSPSRHQLNRLQRELALSKPGAYLNLHFLTFYALADRVLYSENPTPEGRVINEPAFFKEMIRDLLQGTSAIPYLSKHQLIRQGDPVPRSLPGTLADSLRDVRDSGIKVVDAINVAREGHLGDALESSIPILELYALTYDLLRKKNLRTGADHLRRAAERIPTHPWIKRQQAVYLYGFYDLTGVQLDLVLALAKHENASLYFPYEATHPAYAYAESLLPLLRSPAQPLSTSSASSLTPPAYRQAGSSAPVSSEAWSCSGTHDEVWLAAKTIMSKAEAGIAYSEMAVMARSLAPYASIIRDVFDKHQIPYALHAEEPAARYPLVKITRQLLHLHQEGYPESILDELKASVYWNSRKSPSKTNTPAMAPWSEHVKRAKKLLETTLSLPTDATKTEYALWGGILKALESLAVLDDLGDPVSHERFLNAVDDKLDGLMLSLAPTNNAGVQIFDIMSARGLSFQGVCLLGLNEKSFPRLIREDPFLPDKARAALSQALGCRLGRKLDGYNEERLLFHLATSMATTFLHLSCQRTDEEGKALVISLYLQDWLDNTGQELKRLPRTFVERLMSVGSTVLTPKEYSILLNREKRNALPLYEALGWETDLYNALSSAQDGIERFGPIGIHDGVVGETPAAAALLQQGLSPATLKDAAECPFRYFARKILGLSPDDPLVEEGTPTAAATGQIVHEILELFYKRRMQEGNTRDIDGLLSDAIAEVCVRFEECHPDIYPIAWLSIQTELKKKLLEFVNSDISQMKENEYIPSFFEIDLSEKLTIPGAPDLPFRGRIDRIDLKKYDPTAFRVVDYKTGSGGIGKRDKIETAILKGKNFQLPIYLAMASAWLAREKKAQTPTGEAVFYNLKHLEDLEDPRRISMTFWKDCGNRFIKNLNYIIEIINKGQFYIRPSDSMGYCSWCQFWQICRKEHKPSQIRSEKSSARRTHDELFSGQIE